MSGPGIEYIDEMVNSMEYWNMLWEKYQWKQSRPMMDAVLTRICEVHFPKIVVDLGCGISESLETVRNARPDAHLIGVDFAESAIEKNKAADSTIEWICSDIRALPIPDNHAGLVYGSHILEHMASSGDVIQAIKEMYRITKPGGVVVVAVPRQMYFFEHTQIFDWDRLIGELGSFNGPGEPVICYQDMFGQEIIASTIKRKWPAEMMNGSH